MKPKIPLDGDTPVVLDTTLRDGSYTINFQFTTADTRQICGRLQDVGVGVIEVGHGIGLGASRDSRWTAAETDEAYMAAAADTLDRASWGMFCIPGVASLDDVDLAADHGMDFIRIGTNVGETEQSQPFIERAKRHGMTVAANYMKSYTVEPSIFADKVRMSEGFGVDMVYVVDSSGGMMARDLEQYIKAAMGATDLPVGFHGHNNLGLAVANSLLAVELGVRLVDASLQGLGRSAGNTPTELFVIAMKRLGIDLGIDPLALMDVGETFVRPLLDPAGYDSIDVIAGYAHFHSSYMPVIREYSSRYMVDPRLLIIGVCEYDKVNASPELVEKVAQELAGQADDVSTARFRMERFITNEQG